MSLDLNKLSNKLDEALSNETTETLTKFLNDKRMTNNKQQTAVEWLQIQLKKGIGFNPLDPLSYPKAVDDIYQQAKEMEKEQIIDALLFGDVLSPNTAETYYKQTYGGNK
jgi:hypothetical protein